MYKKIFLYTYILIALFVSIFSLKSLSEVLPKPRHYILTVHGLHGNANTFGDFKTVLEAHAKLIQPTFDTKVFTVSYPTTNSQNTYNYSFYISDKLKEIFKNNPLNEQDKISFVTHSQGGVVTWIWYLKSLAKDEGYEEMSEYAKHVDGLITLGTPMWGSRVATLSSNNQFLSFLGKTINIFGPHEIVELSHGSNTIQRFRYRAIEIDNNKNLAVNARTLSIAGSIPKAYSEELISKDGKWKIPTYLMLTINYAEKALASGEHLETDIAVDIPSVRSNFIYAVKSGDKVTFSDFKTLNKKDTNNLIVVDAPHLSWKQNIFYDIAEVPLECLDRKNICTHPTYPYILAHLMNCNSTNSCAKRGTENVLNKFLDPKNLSIHTYPMLNTENLNTFFIDAEVEIPEEIQNNSAALENLIQTARLSFANQDNEGFIKSKNFEIKIGSPRELLSKFKKVSKTSELGGIQSINGKRFLRLTYYGRIKRLDTKSHPFAGYLLPFYITAKGLKSVYVEAIVKPTFSTFVSVKQK